MNEWLLLRTGLGPASWNMALDEALLESAEAHGQPVLRFYGWSEPAATFGYFQKFAEVAAWTSLRPLVRRPTGGGVVPHDRDWTYSLIFPPSHPWFALRAEESYRQAHEWVSQSLAALRVSARLADCCVKELPGQCFAGAEKFDVLADGRKIAGAAQKRNKFGLLIQGSLQPAAAWPRADWEAAMLRIGTEQRGLAWRELEMSPHLQARASELDQAKYAQSAYNQRR